MRKQPTTRPALPVFDPVPVRARSDGWTPEKQIGFIQALTATGSVEQAARHVGMTGRSARDLRTRRDAASFRIAWETAILAGVPALVDAAMERALHGVAVPIFYKGEQVGERRAFNETLTMYLMRHHDQHRYGKWRDKMMVEPGHPDGVTLLLHEAIARLAADLVADQLGQPRAVVAPLRTERIGDDPEAEARDATAKAKIEEMARQAEWESFQRKLAAERAQWEAQARAADGRGTSTGNA